jgi:hypothetical protein
MRYLTLFLSCALLGGAVQQWRAQGQSERLDFLRKAFVKRFHGPLGGAIEADERHRHETKGALQAVRCIRC